MASNAGSATQGFSSLDANLWKMELERLKPELRETRLTQGWADSEQRWSMLHAEWDRLRVIKNDVVWLASAASQRIDAKLLQAGRLIDSQEPAKLSEAALTLSQAEHIIQQAWRSRWYNRWHLRSWPPSVAVWPLMAPVLIGGLMATIYVIYRQDLYPRGESVPPQEALFAASFWGLGGGILIALKTLHERVQNQVFEIERLAWYLLSPIVGFGFGAISFLLFYGGLLSTGQGIDAEGELELDPTPVLLLAVLAGLAQNAFIDFVQRTARSRFTSDEAAESEAAPRA